MLESIPYKQDMQDRKASVFMSPTGSCLVSGPWDRKTRGPALDEGGVERIFWKASQLISKEKSNKGGV